jgi:hypothetical protein
MSGGPEEIRAKVEARKAELQRQAEEREEVARLERQKKKELAAQLASEKLNQLEAVAAARTQSSGARPMPHTAGLHSEDTIAADETQVDEQLVENELDELINKKAHDLWTSGENWMFLVTLVGGIILLFVAWPIGLFSIGFSIFYFNVKQRRYRGMVRKELGLLSMFDGASTKR